MYSESTNYACPKCGAVEMLLDPATRHVICVECDSVFPEASLVRTRHSTPPRPIEPRD